MRVLEIHEVKEQDLNPDYYQDFDLLTFDDGLFSQYYYRDFFNSLGKPRIYFISSGILNYTGNYEFKDPLTAHNDFFTNYDPSGYMSPDMVDDLANEAQIGWHMHFHPCLDKINSNVKQMKIVLDEIEQGQEFIKNYRCKDFCYPYDKSFDFLEHNLKKEGFTSFYGADRIPLEYVKGEQVIYDDNAIASYY